MWSSNAEYSGEPFSAAWDASQALLKTELDPQIYSAYIEPLRFIGFNEEAGEVSIAAPSKFICAQVDKNFGDKLASLLGRELGLTNISLQFSIDSSTDARQR